MENEIKLKRSYSTTIRIKGKLLGRIYNWNEDGPELSVYQAKNGRFFVQGILNVLDKDDLPGLDTYLYRVDSFDTIENAFNYIECEFSDEFEKDEIDELKKDVLQKVE